MTDPIERQLGVLIGTVTSLTSTIEQLRITVEGDRQETLQLLQEHVKEDNRIHGYVYSIIEWRNGNKESGEDGASSKINNLWDQRNKNSGAWTASKIGLLAVWSIVTLVASSLIPHKGG